MTPFDCPICGLRPAVVVHGDGQTVRCGRCGEFNLTRTAELEAASLARDRPDGRYTASRAIRRMQRPTGKPPVLTSYQLAGLWGDPLATPQQQTDWLILLLGDAGLPLGEYVTYSIDRLCAEIGTADDPNQPVAHGLTHILGHLERKGLIEFVADGPADAFPCRLTFDGFDRYGQLKREVVESRTAFMAMGYSNEAVDRVARECFAPAVRQTGFELYRLDDRPKAGLIDNRMRVEIRTAKFLICDLTDENRGAYWEAGFAEGTGKHVFYTCEAQKFGTAKTHFDTEHMFTVLWSLEGLEEAADQLKAAIRNQFPEDAVMPDRASGRA